MTPILVDTYNRARRREGPRNRKTAKKKNSAVFLFSLCRRFTYKQEEVDSICTKMDMGRDRTNKPSEN